MSAVGAGDFFRVFGAVVQSVPGRFLKFRNRGGIRERRILTLLPPSRNVCSVREPMICPADDMFPGNIPVNFCSRQQIFLPSGCR